MPTELDEEGIDASSGSDDELGVEQDPLQGFPIEERRKNDEETLPSLPNPAVRAKGPHRFENFVARDTGHQVRRGLQRTDGNRTPDVQEMHPVG